MGYAVRVCPGLGLGRFFGRVDGGDLVGAVEAMYRAPGWEPGFATAWDGADITALDLGPADIEGVERAFRELGPRVGEGRAAVLLRRGSVSTEVAELFAFRRRRRKGRATRVFHDRASAAAWLGVPEEALHPPEPGAPEGDGDG